MKIYGTKSLPFVLYGCETCSFTLSEKCRLRVFEDRILRKILDTERGGVRGEWRKPHHEEMNNL